MHAPGVKTTILVDNQAAAGLVAEHGFSLWIDTGDQRILFDIGQGPALPYRRCGRRILQTASEVSGADGICGFCSECQ